MNSIRARPAEVLFLCNKDMIGRDEMEEYLTRQEHQEFKEGLEKENHRQNKRIEILENTVRQINDLTLSVQKLANNMEGMLSKQTEQGKRLEELENRDGEKWRQVTGYVITALIGVVYALIIYAVLRKTAVGKQA